jgi:hypothetical protein
MPWRTLSSFVWIAAAALAQEMGPAEAALYQQLSEVKQFTQTAFQAGKTTLRPGAGGLAFADDATPGDQVTVTFDPETKRHISFAVATHLNEQKDAVTMVARFSSLPDGTNVIEESVLAASAKKIQVNTTSSDYRRSRI